MSATTTICQFCSDFTLSFTECLLAAAVAMREAWREGVGTDESLAADARFWEFGNTNDRLLAARTLMEHHP